MQRSRDSATNAGEDKGPLAAALGLLSTQRKRTEATGDTPAPEQLCDKYAAAAAAAAAIERADECSGLQSNRVDRGKREPGCVDYQGTLDAGAYYLRCRFHQVETFLLICTSRGVGSTSFLRSSSPPDVGIA